MCDITDSVPICVDFVNFIGKYCRDVVYAKMEEKRLPPTAVFAWHSGHAAQFPVPTKSEE